jgi:hypothetical protein
MVRGNWVDLVGATGSVASCALYPRYACADLGRDESDLLSSAVPSRAAMTSSLVQLIAKGESAILELKRSTGELREAMQTLCAFAAPALDRGFVEMTIPDKPQSRLQKYRLTERGRAVLAKAKLSR